jgi:hypothetical protein
MARTIKDNKDVIQSYMLTSARYDFSVYEKRIMYRLVELAQSEIQGKKMVDLVGTRVETNPYGDKDVTMPVRAILANEEDKNYTLAKKAFKTMSNRTIEQTKGNIWYLDHMLERVRVNLGTGIATFRVSPEVWSLILDFTKGYRKYELKTTMQFKSVYSMRFYELLAGQKTPISFTLEELKKMLKIDDYTDKDGKHHKEKYKTIQHFESRVLEVAKKELDECSPYSFTYEPIKEPSRGRNGYKVTGYIFHPRFLVKNRDEELYQKELNAKIGNITGRFGMLDKNVSDYLLYNLNVPKKSINSNKDVFLQAQKVIPDLVSVLAEIGPKMREKSKPIGYLIATLKGKIADATKG